MQNPMEQFLKQAQPSYDPKEYTKFLESQLSSEQALQQTVETIENEMNSMRVLYNEEEERINAQTRLIELMQEVLEKEKQTPAQSASCADGARTETLNEICYKIEQLESKFDKIEAESFHNYEHFLDQLTDVRENVSNLQTETDVLQQQSQLYDQSAVREVLQRESLFTNSCKQDGNGLQDMNLQNTISDEVVKNEVDLEKLDEQESSGEPRGHKVTQLADARQTSQASQEEPQLQQTEETSFDAEAIKNNIISTIVAQLPQMISSELQNSLPVLQETFLEKTQGIEKNIAVQLEGLVDNLYDRLKSESSSVTSAEYYERLTAFEASQRQEKQQMKKELEKKFSTRKKVNFSKKAFK